MQTTDLNPLAQWLCHERKKHGGVRQHLADKLGINLEKFAARHGVHSTTLGDYEVGKANISDVKLMELVRMYSVPEAYEEWRKLRHLSGQDPRSHSGDLNDGLCRFGILLRTLRKELGVSQRELCRALGKDSKYICNLEYGYTRCHPGDHPADRRLSERARENSRFLRCG